MAIHSWAHLQWPNSHLHILIPIHDGHQTEPLTCYRAVERVTPRNAQWLHLLYGSSDKGRILSPCQDGRWHGPFLHAHHREAPLYAVGDKVWLNGQNIMTTHLMKKLDHKWLGPCFVDKVISQSAYRLKLPSSFGWTHPIFSVTLLWHYNADAISEQVQCDLPPSVICDGVEEYEMEHILDSQVFWGKLKYLVHWKGYGIKEDEQRLSKDVKGTKRLITDFHQRNPKAPQFISALNFSKLPFSPLTNFMYTLDLWTGILVNACQDTALLNGGWISGFVPFKTISSDQVYVIQLFPSGFYY